MQQVFALIDRDRQAAVELLQALVRIPSDNPPGYCMPAAEATVARLRALGFNPELHEVPASLVAEHGMTSAANVIVRHRFGAGPTIALNAHGDVVPPGAGWHTDPYGGALIDGWIYGRGAAVSKSDIASYAFALKALIESGISLAGSVELHITFDEETGGYIGPAWILSQGLSKPDYAICAAFSYAVITAHNGCLHLEVTLSGRSAHAAWAETGHDALEAATDLMSRLYAHRDELKSVTSTIPGLSHPSLVIGLIKGGINTNVVPDSVTLRLDRRILPDENPERVEAELTALIARIAATRPGISATVRRVLLARPLMPLPGSDRLAGILTRHASEQTGESVVTVASPLYTDARHYAEAGIPVVMFGAGPKNPLDANGHRADERVPVATLAIASKVVAATILDLLKV